MRWREWGREGRAREEFSAPRVERDTMAQRGRGLPPIGALPALPALPALYVFKGGVMDGRSDDRNGF